MIEMPEGTAGATRESTGRNAGRVFRRTIQELAILDEEPLQATCAYIDLNPVAAGIVDVPEASPHTSITERVEHVKAQGRTGDLEAAGKGSVAGSNAAKGLEDSHWLCPIEDRRRLDSTREGMIEGFSVGSYLLLIKKKDRQSNLDVSRCFGYLQHISPGEAP
jgi:hypothetical protein